MFQELIITKSKWRRRVWIIGGIAGAIALALLIAAIVLLTTNSKDSNTTQQNALSLEDFLQGRLSTRSFNASWISGECTYSSVSFPGIAHF